MSSMLVLEKPDSANKLNAALSMRSRMGPAGYAAVGLSQWLAGPNHPALMSRQLWLIDRMFAALPRIAHTVVNPGFFADSPYLEMMPFAAHLGVFPLPVAGESLNAPPSVDDIARVA